jgi:transposase
MDATPILVPEPDPAEDAHTISRKGARIPQVEVITRGERRRVWTVEQKREIVAESLGSTLTPTEVARKHGISSGLLYGWRQKLIGGQMTLLQQSPPGFARVEIAPTHTDKHDPEPATSTAPPAPDVPVQRPPGLIEILLPENVTLRVDSRVDGQALRRVLAALAAR